MEAVRRAEDGELCGYVERSGLRWQALTTFRGLLGSHEDRASAVDHLLEAGLSSLAERWTLRHGERGDEEIVCIQEVSGDEVTVARGYYSLPGVPTLTITREQFARGEWELHH